MEKMPISEVLHQIRQRLQVMQHSVEQHHELVTREIKKIDELLTRVEVLKMVESGERE